MGQQKEVTMSAIAALHFPIPPTIVTCVSHVLRLWLVTDYD